MADPFPLRPGIYEKLLTEALYQQLLALDATAVRSTTAPVEPAEAARRFSHHLAQVVERVLSSLSGKERIQKQTAVINALLSATLPAGTSHDLSLSDDEQLRIPATELRSIESLPTKAGLAPPDPTPSPLIPVSASDLLVNARDEPGLAHNLAREIPSADSIDLICAFVRWHGIRLLEGPLREHCKKGRPLRVITTVYTGSTERKAIDWLVSLGAEVRVSYDTEATRLHAKAWRFHRESRYSTVYIGSSNLTKSALLDGVEWNVRLSEVTSPDILNKFEAAFETYWSSSHYLPYDPRIDADRLDAALRRAGSQGTAASVDTLAFFDVQPRPHQEAMLERLSVERLRHGRHKNLVVAATGTGKTVVAALDFKTLRTQLAEPTLLFVAHRQEILGQALGTFRHVLRDNTFGELYVGGQKPKVGRHVFASVQSLAHRDLAELHPASFDVVIVDEFHHATADTYSRLLNHVRPKELVGLTATPERADGESVLKYFDDYISVELRLWDALDQGLLCPFQYFGLNDQTDLSTLRWSKKGYDTAALVELYTDNESRVNLVLEQLRQKLNDPGKMTALGFCVSIAHAQFMADRFTRAGLLSEAISADTDPDVRRAALLRLENGQVRALFAVDIFNEGVDLPSVDTLMFLRPTESPVVFMQQLGRGLRRAPNKPCVTVLDFIGKPHRHFRFDLRYRAISGGTRTEVERQIEAGFPSLPAGCTIQLDRVAQDIVLSNLRSAIPNTRPRMVAELTALAQSSRFGNRHPTLEEFLQETRLELEDVYRNTSWSGLRREAGLERRPTGPHEDRIRRRIRLLLHVDDELRLRGYRQIAGSAPGSPHDALYEGIYFSLLNGIVEVPDVKAISAVLAQHPAILTELVEVLDVLEKRTKHLTYALNAEAGWAHDVPLSVHAQHSTDDILTGFGLLGLDQNAFTQKGVFRDDRTNSDLFLVTLQKSERDYSPSTRYKDYAISATRFHWQSQSGDTQASETGQRYINHQELGGHIFIFVRHHKEVDNRTMPYLFLGPATYVSHEGQRPINFIWELKRPMPADFLADAKPVGG
jgi:superfamily II DNA or RNA helicase/HKD family nuclease